MDEQKYRIIKTEEKKCLCCMETHDVKLVAVEETTIFKGVPVKHIARYEYCDTAEEFLSDGELIASNDIAMKNAYRKAMHLLTTDEIVAIREKYAISQKDLALVLGWGEKTITRYEGHQVQDAAHDFVLRKIDEEPVCFFEFLERRKDSISDEAYGRYKATVDMYSRHMQDAYLRKAIASEYLRYQNDLLACGNTELNLDKVVAVINYFANSLEVNGLYNVKLMKLLWYADFLSFKRRNKGITGLVYQALPMGAVPIGHKSIINLEGVRYEEIEFENGSGIHFKGSEEITKGNLDKQDVEVLDFVIAHFGKLSKAQIVDKMHEETAYRETLAGEVISYEYAQRLRV